MFLIKPLAELEGVSIKLANEIKLPLEGLI